MGILDSYSDLSVNVVAGTPADRDYTAEAGIMLDEIAYGSAVTQVSEGEYGTFVPGQFDGVLVNSNVSPADDNLCQVGEGDTVLRRGEVYLDFAAGAAFGEYVNVEAAGTFVTSPAAGATTVGVVIKGCNALGTARVDIVGANVTSVAAVAE